MKTRLQMARGRFGFASGRHQARSSRKSSATRPVGVASGASSERIDTSGLRERKNLEGLTGPFMDLCSEALHHVAERGRLRGIDQRSATETPRPDDDDLGVAVCTHMTYA